MDIDPSTIVPQLVEDFENALGVVLKAGDQRREFLQGFGYVFTTALQQVEMTGEVNLLQYAYGTYLDKLGELVGVTRLPADYADCTVQFTLSGAQPQAVQVPEGTRVTPDGTLFFATTACRGHGFQYHGKRWRGGHRGRRQPAGAHPHGALGVFHCRPFRGL